MSRPIELTVAAVAMLAHSEKYALQVTAYSPVRRVLRTAAETALIFKQNGLIVMIVRSLVPRARCVPPVTVCLVAR